MSPRALLAVFPLLAALACDPPAPQIVMVRPSGTTSAVSVSPETQQAITQTLDNIASGATEPVPAADLAAAQDPTALLGRWQITQTRGTINGVASEPAEPLMPTAWVFTADGRMKVDGGMQIDAGYTYTGKKLFVSGMGPTLEYSILELSGTELEVLHRITAGDTLVIENTTILKKVP
ncbi:MAG: hypothetical protein Q8P18_22380 [Pseudomonadota bacterium]|nr:hypothetical protein [Pseudomonadota bacterium]